jgi:hypothetical protein
LDETFSNSGNFRTGLDKQGQVFSRLGCVGVVVLLPLVIFKSLKDWIRSAFLMCHFQVSQDLGGHFQVSQGWDEVCFFDASFSSLSRLGWSFSSHSRLG